MKTLVTPTRLALGAAAVLALLVVPVALAGSEGDPQATASTVQTKIKKLKKQVKKANRAIAELQQQVGNLQGEQGGARPPSGPAGGDLTGTFPNPQIGTNTVGTAELQTDSVTEPKIAAGAVGTSELQDDGVTGPKIAANAVGNSELQFNSVTAGQIADKAVGQFELGDTMLFQHTESIPPNGGVGDIQLNCPSGALITGGAEFAFPSGDLSASRPVFGAWFAEGQNNGTVAQDLTVYALCLQPGA